MISNIIREKGIIFSIPSCYFGAFPNIFWQPMKTLYFERNKIKIRGGGWVFFPKPSGSSNPIGYFKHLLNLTPNKNGQKKFPISNKNKVGGAGF